MNKNELINHIENFKNGDKSEFEVIYLETNNKLYNYIFSLSDSLNSDDCIELVQETYIQVNNKIDTLKDCRSFYSWMFTIARNKTLRYLEKRKKKYYYLKMDKVFLNSNMKLMRIFCHRIY